MPETYAMSIDDLYNDGVVSVDGSSFVDVALGDGTSSDTSGLLYVLDRIEWYMDGGEESLFRDNVQILYARANNQIANVMGLGTAIENPNEAL